MTEPLTVLEEARHDAQRLYKKISTNIDTVEATTLADVKAAQADILALAARIKTLASDQADSVKTGLTTAAARMEDAGKALEAKAGDAQDGIKHANAALLESAQAAAESLGNAVTAMRRKAAHAIAPKADTA
jgi:hypothetical protein